MIQRIQSVYLVLALVLSVVTAFAGHHSWPLMAVQLGIAVLNLYTTFIYKHRNRQSLYCLVAIFLHFGWYIGLIVYSKHVAPDAQNFQLAWPDVMPMISVILTFLARRAILADEKMVRAADRLR